MRMYDIIEKKRDGGELTKEETAFFVRGAVDGTIPDYQISAMLMAIYLKGMSDSETCALTREMAASGDSLDLSCFGNLSADKHSTGGVGDKTTLIAAPVAASLGVRIAKMSGRGLGHTGGTIDKLESIPGFCTELDTKSMITVAEEHGICVAGAGAGLDPADKKLYALRDVTATVGSIPLIVSSIMSKKLAGGAHNIVLDVKCGSGSFMKTPEDARVLAEKMVDIGKAHKRRVSAVITNMDIPLGSAVGNRLEVAEAVRVLRASHDSPDLTEVSLALAAEMISLSLEMPAGESMAAAKSAIENGSAYNKFREWISAQGGDPDAIDRDDFCRSAYHRDIKSPDDGYIVSCDTEGIGIASVILGAGRNRREDKIDPCAGIIIHKKRGDMVKRGECIATLYTDRKETLEAAERKYLESHTFGQSAPAAEPLIYAAVR